MVHYFPPFNKIVLHCTIYIIVCLSHIISEMGMHTHIFNSKEETHELLRSIYNVAGRGIYNRPAKIINFFPALKETNFSNQCVLFQGNILYVSYKWII